MAGLRVGFIVERRYLRQEMPAAAIRALRGRGVEVEVLCPQDCRFDPEDGRLQCAGGAELDLRRFDAVVSRNRSALGLAMLAFADAAGIPTVNAYAAVQRVRNKAEMAVALGKLGVPGPQTFLADDVAALAELPDDAFPLILKATFGDNSQGLRLVRRAEDLADLHWGDELVVAQHYLPNDGFDLKLYVCGRQVFAVRKPSPFNGDPAISPRPIEPSPAMVDLALRCGAAFGLEVYGVDTIQTDEGLAVIEVNDYPNFSRVPDAAERIAEHVLRRVGRRSLRLAGPAAGRQEVRHDAGRLPASLRW